MLDQPDCLLWKNVETERVMTLARHLAQHSHVEAGGCGLVGGVVVRVENWLKWLRLLEAVNEDICNEMINILKKSAFCFQNLDVEFFLRIWIVKNNAVEFPICSEA